MHGAVDSGALARELLTRIAPEMEIERANTIVAIAQVHATLAVADEVKALRELFSNGDGTHAYVQTESS